MLKYLRNIIIKLILINLIFFGINYERSIAQDDSKKSSSKPDSTNQLSIEKNKKSACGAVLRSMIIPGWGQFYNSQKFKSLLFLGGEVGLLINSYYLNNASKNKNYHDEDRDYYKLERNFSICFLATAYFAGLLDAYWDAKIPVGINIARKDNIKSPQGAMIRSIIIPGWGQYYNEKRFKSLLFFGGEISILTRSIIFNQKYRSGRSDHIRNTYIELRNQSTWFLVATVLISMMDAYVDAHLSTFDESPDLSFYVKPNILNNEFLIDFSIAF